MLASSITSSRRFALVTARLADYLAECEKNYICSEVGEGVSIKVGVWDVTQSEHEGPYPIDFRRFEIKSDNTLTMTDKGVGTLCWKLRDGGGGDTLMSVSRWSSFHGGVDHVWSQMFCRGKFTIGFDASFSTFTIIMDLEVKDFNTATLRHVEGPYTHTYSVERVS